MTGKFRTELVYLAPVLASMLFGVLCSYLILSASIEAIQVTPFTGGNFESILNGLYFVILVSVGAALLYVLLRRKSHRLITLLTGFAVTAAVLMLSLIYLSATFSSLEIPYGDAVIVILSIAVTVLADYTIFRSNSRFSNLVILGIGGGLGAFLGFSIPTESTVVILAFLAIYDAYAVYRGSVGKIARGGLDQFRGLSFSFKNIQMGLGDLTFYSMLSGHMLVYFGYASCALSIIGILVGCLLSFKMLERKGMFPGLPFPVALGLAGGLLTALVVG